MLQTEFEFELPRGYMDSEGNLHKQGVMRLATAIDEIAPMRDARVKANDAYHTVILLSRVVTRLGELRAINPHVIENLFSGDLAYLQDFYSQINENGHRMVEIECPHCETSFEFEGSHPGE